MNNNFLLITSKKNKYFGQIEKLMSESLINTTMVYIEDNFDDENFDIIYSFTTLDKVDKRYINYKFYQNYKSKLEVQLQLRIEDTLKFHLKLLQLFY